MKYFVYKNSIGLKSANVWFLDDKESLKKIEADVLHIWGCNEPILHSICKKQLTLIIDLKKNEEELFKNINKTVRYEINRSIKENIKFSIYTSSELRNNPSIIKEFQQCYDEMYKEKNLDTRLNIEEFKLYIENDMVYLSISSDEEENLVYHVYTYDEKNVRFLYSSSTFRASLNKKNVIGRANKFLHWRDIQFFKSIGIYNYDLGGIVSYENPNGIDKFKINLGGVPISYYNVFFGKTSLGKLGIMGLKLKNKDRFYERKIKTKS